VCGKTAGELFPVTGYRTLAQDMLVINSGKQMIDLLCLYFSAEGGKPWCLSTKYPIYDDDGAVQAQARRRPLR
jgi:hypothetical protein